MPDILDQETRETIMSLIFEGRKIQAIKVYRESTGSNLKQSKEFIEALTDELREMHPDKFKEKAAGCGTAVLGFVLGSWWVWELF